VATGSVPVWEGSTISVVIVADGDGNVTIQVWDDLRDEVLFEVED